MSAPIQRKWSGQVAGTANLNSTTHGSGTTAQRNVASPWPTDRPWFDTTLNSWLSNTGVEATPVWSQIGGDWVNNDELTYPFSFTDVIIDKKLKFKGTDVVKTESGSIGQVASILSSGQILAIADDFSDYANDTAFDAVWVQITGDDVNPNATNDRIDFSCDYTTDNNHGVYRDLGTTVANTWVLRFKLVISSFTSNDHASQPIRITISVASSTASGFLTNQDGIGLSIKSLSTSDDYMAVYLNDEQWDATLNETSYTGDTPGVETRWVEIVRTSSTTYNMTMFTDEYVTDSGTALTGLTVSSATTGLRYLKVESESDSDPTAGAISGYIDDIQFYDGVTSV